MIKYKMFSILYVPNQKLKYTNTYLKNKHGK